MSKTALIFPHQLFSNHPALSQNPNCVLLIEHPLFFGDAKYPTRMHKQKLAYHRATMANYIIELTKREFNCELVPYKNGKDPLQSLCKQLARENHNELLVADVHDDT